MRIKKVKAGAAAIAVAALFLATSAGAAVLDLAPFSHTCAFTVSGYQGSIALDGFPVLIRISESISGFSYSDCDADGADLRFTDGTGELLPHEIDTWDTAGESSVWVKVPTLSGTATAIHLYYGVSAPTTLSAVNARDVWTKYILDLTDATGLTIDDFELITDNPRSIRLRIVNGILCAVRPGTFIIVR